MKLENKNIFCSVSAGYSSVLMAVKIREWFPDHRIIFGMANTSKESPESLEFMHKCDQYYNLGLHWIEALINQEPRVGTEYRVVDYSDLKTEGEIFEQGIKKYGIPSKVNKWCNRDLKLVPMKKFCDDTFGAKNYSIAVGMRSDEIDRISKNYKQNNVFYPLFDRGISYRDRNRFWKDQPIKLEIPAYKGNCDLCFEKSNRKLMTILKEEPDKGKWWQNQIDKYGNIEFENKPYYNDLLRENEGMTFYREYRTIEDLVKLAEQPFRKATDEYVYENDLFDLEGDCGSGCKVF